MKLPPYARPLYELISTGFRPDNDVNLFVGQHAWKKGKSSSVSYTYRTIALPPWLSPSSFFWPVNQCDILIVDTGYAEESYTHELVYCLYKDGANNVRLVAPDYSIVLFEKDF